jgi:hypothetical protein
MPTRQMGTGGAMYFETAGVFATEVALTPVYARQASLARS